MNTLHLVRNAMCSKYENLKLIIADEISMFGPKNHQHFSLALQHIFQNFEQPCAGVFFTVGDLQNSKADVLNPEKWVLQRCQGVLCPGCKVWMTLWLRVCSCRGVRFVVICAKVVTRCMDQYHATLCMPEKMKSRWPMGHIFVRKALYAQHMWQIFLD